MSDMKTDPKMRLWLVDVTVTYAVLAETEGQACGFAPDAVAAESSSSLRDVAEARLAVDDCYMQPADMEGNDLVFGPDRRTWDEAVAIDRQADPQAAALVDERMAKLDEARQRMLADIEAWKAGKL